MNKIKYVCALSLIYNIAFYNGYEANIIEAGLILIGFSILAFELVNKPAKKDNTDGQ